MLLLLIGGFAVSLVFCIVLIRLGAAGMMLDQPNERSLHVVPVPRTGGIAIGLGLLPTIVPVFLIGELQTRLLIFGFLMVFMVSLLDDLRALPVWIRLGVHFAAALLIVLDPTYPDVPWIIALGLFWIVWGANLFNFMDGMDGLAGSMAVIGGITLSLVFFSIGAQSLSWLVAGAAAAVAGFLIFNRPPARIFMGDAGSASLGFLFAATSVTAVGSGDLPAWLPLLAFLPFVADATFTLFRRVLFREPFWRAHRTHAYQRLVLAGWSVRRTWIVESVFMLLCTGVVLLLPWNDLRGWQALGVIVIFGAILYWGIMRMFSKASPSVGNGPEARKQQ